MQDHILAALLPSSPLAALAAAFVAGLLSVATPCVLPMVPITLATVGITRATSRGRAFLTAAAYMAGIVLTFTALGVAFALSGRMLGSLLSHPATAIVLAALFVAMALSSFEVLPFRLPNAVTQLASKVGGHGPPGAFAAGLVAGFIAAPCIGPVLAAILSYVSTTRDAVFGAALLASYGIGFGLPFLVVGAFALRLPKSGPWMTAIKGFFGIVLLAGAFWFLRGAFPVLRAPASLVYGLMLGIGGIAIYALVASMRERPAGSRWLLPVSALAATLGAALAINAVMVQPLEWCAESPQRSCMPAACAAHRRTIVLFTAAWCPACRELEHHTLADPRVRERLQNYGTIIVDVDRNNDLAESANISGIPTMIVLDESCQGVARIEGAIPPGQLLRALDRIENR
ncbi:MAG TPA: cytochrome c biogenesis protein CcdA [Candidatus Binatia bacterium]|nr:cytochrome c biogenesis protein CcdA [Candidatus Binatia bacterium]